MSLLENPPVEEVCSRLMNTVRRQMVLGKATVLGDCSSPQMINWLGCLQEKGPCLISDWKYVFGQVFKDLWNYFIE